MKLRYISAILTLLIAVSGCTQYWYQPGVSIEQAQVDHRECFKGVLEQSAITSMTSAEIQMMNACMMRKGYGLVFSYELPKAADRANPITIPHWKLNGVAGVSKPKDYPLFEY